MFALATRSLAVAALASALAAQSLWTMDTLGNTQKIAGPPDGACGYPGGPQLSLWSYDTSFFCPIPSAFPATSNLGDLAYDPVNSALWITDGKSIGEYQTFGTPVRGFQPGAGTLLPGDFTGMAWDTGLSALWLTDGTSAVAAQPPGASGCPGVATVLLGPLTLPLASGAIATDLDWDARTQSLWVADDMGNVSEVLPTGALGPNGTFAVVPPLGCTLGALTGIAVDRAAPIGTLFVTDGATILRCVAPTGAAAPTTFYAPQTCWNPSLAVQGLAFEASSLIYGLGSAGIFPFIGSGGGGESTVPNPGFAITIGGGRPNELVGLILGFSPLCPSVVVAGAPLEVGPPFSLQTTTTLGPTGLFTAPLPIGPTAPIGVSAYFQWFTFNPTTLAVKSTPGLAVTLASPY